MAAGVTQHLDRRCVQCVGAGRNRQWLQFRERICLGYPARVWPEKERAGRAIIAGVLKGKIALVVEGDVNLKLAGKVALVTGSTAGIGFAIAQSLAIEGAHVYVNGRTQKRVDAAMAGIRSHAATAKVDGIAAEFSGSVGAEVVIAKL